MATAATDALYQMLTTLTNSVASLVGSMTGMTPLITQAITASATASKAAEELNDTLEEAAKTKSKLAFDPPREIRWNPGERRSVHPILHVLLRRQEGGGYPATGYLRSVKSKGRCQQHGNRLGKPAESGHSRKTGSLRILGSIHHRPPHPLPAPR